MGVKRTQDTGQKDSLGRPIKVSGNTPLAPERLPGGNRTSVQGDFTPTPFDISELYEENNDYESPAICDILGLVENLPHVHAHVVTSGDKDNVLIALRGIPGSGKSTITQAWTGMDDNRVALNRDNFRLTMYGKSWGLGKHQEELITQLVRNGVASSLQSGDDVIVDETMLKRAGVRDFGKIATGMDADFVIINVDPPLEDALQRAQQRAEQGGRHVPEEVIRNMYQKFCPLEKQKPITAEDIESRSTEFPAYECRSGITQPTVLFDIDGTLADMTRSGRGPFDWHRVGEDDPNHAVIEQLKINQAAGNAIVIMSGRDSVSRAETEKWLDEHGITYDAMFMRGEKDDRRDSIVKRELLENVEDNFGPVVGVYDDRDQVVSMWRQIGLPCFQVNYGDF